MSGNERRTYPRVEEYSEQARRCRDEARRTSVRERRYELEAEAEHLESIVKEMLC
jgi:hypothetical protein